MRVLLATHGDLGGGDDASCALQALCHLEGVRSVALPDPVTKQGRLTLSASARLAVAPPNRGPAVRTRVRGTLCTAGELGGRWHQFLFCGQSEKRRPAHAGFDDVYASRIQPVAGGAHPGYPFAVALGRVHACRHGRGRALGCRSMLRAMFVRGRRNVEPSAASRLVLASWHGLQIAARLSSSCDPLQATGVTWSAVTAGPPQT